MSEDSQISKPPPGSLDQVVRLGGVAMSGDAKRKIIAIWKDDAWGHQDLNYLVRAFQVGLEDGRAAQPNIDVSRTKSVLPANEKPI